MNHFVDASLKDFSKNYENTELAKIFHEIEKNALTREPYWSEENYLSHILSSDDRIFVMEEKESILAFIFYRQIASEIEVTHWSVLEKGKGKGTFFFKEFLNQKGKKSTKIILECGEWNHAAHSIYRNFGFNKSGFRPSYYRTGEGAWILERVLDA